MRPRLALDPTPVHLRTGSRWWDAPGELRGINLRSWIVLELADSRGSVSVDELVERLDASGLQVGGRLSKTISDALRWEVRRGRAVRLERGRYAVGRLAGSTKLRMRRRLAACRARSIRPAPTRSAGRGVDERPEVRQAREFFASLRAVAQKRNETATPTSDHALLTGRPPP